MNDRECTRLAGLARAAVAEGRDATLVMTGSQRPVPRFGDSDTTLLLYDDGGRPTLVHPADCPLADAWGRQALLTFAADHTDITQLTVVLGGLLTRVRQETWWPFITITALQVSQVAVQVCDRGTGGSRLIRVPIGSYWRADSASLAAKDAQRAL